MVKDFQKIDYCARYGFDQDKINARLALLRLKVADHTWAEILQREIFTPHVHSIIDAFYAQRLQHPEVSRILDKGFSLDHLKETQIGDMRTLSLGFDTPRYFNELRIGSTHQRVGVLLSLYQSSFALLQELMLAHIPDSRWATHAKVLGLSVFIFRMTALNMSLAIETLVDALAQLIDTLRGEAKILRQRAGMDELTGLANHSRILEHSVARRIRAAVQRSDRVGRYGGEESLVIQQNSDLATGIQVADRIRRRIAESPIKRLAIPVTISLGVARLKDSMDLYDLVERADQAMYVAKQAGRNRVIGNGMAVTHGLELDGDR